ncbi:hypothetical protein HOY80DRAFT_1055249 [Tuber brumale]|nr:hypothetical protein HOY80DRAFT_1055249 [Tuber brumale]
MAWRIKDIQLRLGLAISYTSKTAIAVLKIFTQKLFPQNQTVEAIFLAFLLDEYSKYKTTSHSLIINTNTNNYKDVENVYHRWCTVVALWDFEGGDACFPEHGVIIDCPPSSIIFIYSYAVEYYIGASVSNCSSVVHFIYQAIHDAYVESTGKPLSEFNKMPE